MSLLTIMRTILRHHRAVILVAGALSVSMFFQNCAKVEFTSPVVQQQSLGVEEESEIFELSSSGMVDQADDLDGSIVLSGTVGSTAAMGPATDNQANVLFTGFYSIHSSFVQ